MVVPFAEQRVAACIVHKKRLISVGVNSKRTDPFAVKFQKNPHAIYLHAETAAIKKAKRLLSEKQLKKSTLYICRLSKKDDSWALSAPCLGCRRAILENNIGKIIYTTNPNQYDILLNTSVSCQDKVKV